MPRYNPNVIEPKWQAYWAEHRTFATPRLPGAGQSKLYALDMFPYPSGNGLHVGHPEGYTATDIVCRAARMRGQAVMHPMGFDSFGLPAEEHAIKTGEHPRVQTEANIATFRRQLRMLGFSYDWDREVATTDVAYFRWTQWIFLQIYDTWFDHEQQCGRPIAELPIPAEVAAKGNLAVEQFRDEHRLAFQSQAPVNWCPALGTVLANEEVVDGKSERGGHPVVRMPLRQWMLRITAYAQRLEDDLESLDWPAGVKALQRNWIGKSTGAEVDFAIATGRPWNAPAAGEFPAKPADDVLRVYTTRPDTLFGATYMVIAPEHPLVGSLTTEKQKAAVDAYVAAAALKSDLDRTELAKDKTGVFTGSFAVNPVNEKDIPIWIADYVLATYGTGAIMAVPAHDERDFEFAKKFGIPIVAVVDPGESVTTDERAEVLAGHRCSTASGVAVNSGIFDGTPTTEFKTKIANWLSERGLGRAAVNFKLRDWLFSRQRFWGEPFPLLHELDSAGNKTGRIVPVPVDQLPVDLPHLEDFKPHGRPEPPLDKAPDDWLYPVINGVRYKRETNTMPQWAGSCWYYLRFLDPTNSERCIDPAIEQAWMPVDLYIGGAEHAVLHLLYSRFWHKVLYDRGVVGTPEPFHKLVNQGMILGENNEKMSKSRGNVVNPDDVVREYGADSLRLYEMFMGPLEATKPWSMHGVSGVHGFLSRLWRLVVDERAEELTLNPNVASTPPSADELRMLHKTIDAVTTGIDSLSFNTAIAKMMEYVNYLTKRPEVAREAIEPLVLLVSPFAPHLAEELWQLLGHTSTLAYAPWPEYRPELAKDEAIEVPVQISGKVRGKVVVAPDADQQMLLEAAKAEPRIAELLAGKQIVKEIVVPGRLVNIVIRG